MGSNLPTSHPPNHNHHKCCSELLFEFFEDVFCKKSFARPAVECSKYPMSVPHKYEAGYKYNMNMKMDFLSI